MSIDDEDITLDEFIEEIWKEYYVLDTMLHSPAEGENRGKDEIFLNLRAMTVAKDDYETGKPRIPKRWLQDKPYAPPESEQERDRADWLHELIRESISGVDAAHDRDQIIMEVIVQAFIVVQKNVRKQIAAVLIEEMERHDTTLEDLIVSGLFPAEGVEMVWGSLLTEDNE